MSGTRIGLAGTAWQRAVQIKPMRSSSRRREEA